VSRTRQAINQSSQAGKASQARKQAKPSKQAINQANKRESKQSERASKQAKPASQAKPSKASKQASKPERRRRKLQTLERNFLPSRAANKPVSASTEAPIAPSPTALRPQIRRASTIEGKHKNKTNQAVGQDGCREISEDFLQTSSRCSWPFNV
jgi:hypothetical protein